MDKQLCNRLKYCQMILPKILLQFIYLKNLVPCIMLSQIFLKKNNYTNLKDNLADK